MAKVKTEPLPKFWPSRLQDDDDPAIAAFSFATFAPLVQSVLSEIDRQHSGPISLSAKSEIATFVLERLQSLVESVWELHEATILFTGENVRVIGWNSIMRVHNQLKARPYEP